MRGVFGLQNDSRDSESGIARFFRDRDCTVETADSPDGSQEAEDECEARRPSSQVLPPRKSKLGGVEVRPPRDGKTDNGDQCEQDVQDHTGGLQSGKSGRTVSAVDPAKDQDTAVEPKLGIDRHRELGILQGGRGEEDAGTCPGERGHGGNVAQE